MPTTGWVYDLFMKPLGWLGLTGLRRRLVRNARGRTLEVGAGTGLNLGLYGLDASPLIALDVDHDGLVRGRRRRPLASFVRASVEALPFKDATFDSAVSCLVFCSVPHPATGLGEIRRVLRAGGELTMLEHVRPPGRLLGWLADRLTPVWRRLAAGCHLNRRTPETLVQAGLASTRTGLLWGGTIVELRAHRSDHETDDESS